MNKLIVALLFLLLLFSCEKERQYIKLKVDDKMIVEWEKDNLDELIKCCDLFKESGSQIILTRAFKRMVRNRILNKVGNIEKNASIKFYELYGNDNNSLIDVVINDKKVKSFVFNFSKDEIILKENKKGEVFNRDRKEIYNSFNDEISPCCDINNGAHPSIGIYSLLKLQEGGSLKLVKTITK